MGKTPQVPLESNQLANCVPLIVITLKDCCIPEVRVEVRRRASEPSGFCIETELPAHLRTGCMQLEGLDNSLVPAIKGFGWPEGKRIFIVACQFGFKRWDRAIFHTQRIVRESQSRIAEPNGDRCSTLLSLTCIGDLIAPLWIGEQFESVHQSGLRPVAVS